MTLNYQYLLNISYFQWCYRMSLKGGPLVLFLARLSQRCLLSKIILMQFCLVLKAWVSRNVRKSRSSWRRKSCDQNTLYNNFLQIIYMWKKFWLDSEMASVLPSLQSFWDFKPLAWIWQASSHGLPPCMYVLNFVATSCLFPWRYLYLGPWTLGDTHTHKHKQQFRSV